MPDKNQLPYALYTAEQVRHLDRIVIEQFDIAGSELMQRAGQAAFQALIKNWPDVKTITILTGTGNNAGDGFVVGWLALQAGLTVHVLQLGDRDKFSRETSFHAQQYLQQGGVIQEYNALPESTDVIVDAMFGTGLSSPVKGQWQDAIGSINRHHASVMALDIPSGLNADTGAVMGSAVKADLSVSFIGLKRGMFTAAAREYCGEILFHALDIPARVYASEILSSRRIDWQKMKSLVPTRSRIAHKGHFGHVLLIGGNTGLSGAIRLASEAAARAGAGLVSVATHPSHAVAVNTGCPELMVHPVASGEDLEILFERCSVVVIGPGLGKTDWSKKLLDKTLQYNLPTVMDADALNLLADADPKMIRNAASTVLTPHPGEAARLLQCSIDEIEADRFNAAEQLRQRYGATIVLKGAGTLISSGGNRPVAVCSQGNPGMASGGMGDVLSGIIGSLIGQGLQTDEAACTGVALHAAAGDRAAKDGEIGMLASDLMQPVRELLNA